MDEIEARIYASRVTGWNKERTGPRRAKVWHLYEVIIVLFEMLQRAEAEIKRMEDYPGEY
jgi:hypothetical protein